MSPFQDAMGRWVTSRQDVGGVASSSSQVVVDCDSGNGYDGRLGLRISSIFVILVGSLLGALLPVVLARSTVRTPKLAFFIAKYFGTGVIIATAFMHLLSPAFEALGSPCLDGLPISDYSWAAGICFMTIMVMFTMELLVSHFDIFGDHDHDHEAARSDRSLDVLQKRSRNSQAPKNDHVNDAIVVDTGGRDRDTESQSELPHDMYRDDHLGHQRDHAENDSYTAFAAQMTAIFILEFGVIFHSIFIGLTLAVTGDEFTVLYIVLVFHQTFEGLGLGARLATARWPKGKAYVPYLLACLYAVSTPIAIAIGLGVRESLQPSGANTLIINGIFDSISAGILIYTGLVELLAHEFMFNAEMRKAGIKTQMLALSFVFLGGGLMALLAKWA